MAVASWSPCASVSSSCRGTEHVPTLCGLWRLRERVRSWEDQQGRGGDGGVGRSFFYQGTQGQAELRPGPILSYHAP